MPTETPTRESRSCIWLNVDADLELENPEGYRPSARMLGHVRALAETLESRLRRHPEHADTIVLFPGCDDVDCSGLVGDAWCPTPRALRALARLGARPPEAPDLDVLRRVNHRRFAAQTGSWLPNARFVRSMDELEATLAKDTSTEWLLKRPFGFSGRARKRVRGLPLTPEARSWAAASMTQYGVGLQVEPFVEIAREFAVHGFVRRGGGPHELRDIKGLETTADGAWLDSRALRAGELEDDVRFVLLESARDSAHALATAGYFGPFCVDAFCWRDRTGRERLQPRSEINARYSLGFW